MVGSENFKLLYDIYHMQIMEGNIIETITKLFINILATFTPGEYQEDMNWMKLRNFSIRQS